MVIVNDQLAAFDTYKHRITVATHTRSLVKMTMQKPGNAYRIVAFSSFCASGNRTFVRTTLAIARAP